jgi:hypothetical protein
MHREVVYYGLDEFLGFGVEGKISKVVGFMGSDCCKIRHGFCDYSGSVSGATELEVVGYQAFQLLLQLNQVSCGF